jgi:photosystem II stability/assembly factor-like uncharacterized protein
MISRDDGESFHWVCEAAMGYAGTFDPEYAVFPDGTIFLSTQSDISLDGGNGTTGDLRRSRDGGCTFETVGAGIWGEFPTLSEVERGPDGRLWVGTGTSGEPNDFWVSDDQGETFVSANLAEDKVWWYTLRTTAADSDRIYATGFRPVDLEAGTPAVAILRRSDDGGQTWSDLPVDGFVFGNEQILDLLGVSPVDPEVVFARTVNSVGGNSDILYRSADGGVSWTEMARYETLPLSSFWISPDGQRVIAGAPFPCPGDPLEGGGAAPNGCVRISEDGGVTWRRAAHEPRLACIGERSDGTLFGCTERTIDGHSLARSTDGGDTWEPVYRFRDTVGPLECPAGTAQAECAVEVFPRICEGAGMCPGSDAGPGDDGDETGDGGGCCKVGGGAAIDAGWLPVLALALLLLRRRR